ncbi:hypothetical protein [Corynebacterium kalinowskii]|uniref:hypothetical protein n=1 Tax=Corynebacterium kalinowskii TaxID=2675216 RepID=UPI0012E27C51|nr:hypothetical protein [Corynebacterium kalinowskii]
MNQETPPFEWVEATSFSNRVLIEEAGSLSAITLLQRMRLKMDQAARGELSFGRTHRFDVDCMVSCRDILEIKYRNLPPDCNVKKKWLRLYFTEPADTPGRLLALTLKLKFADDPEGQTNDALDAYNQFQLHLSRD